METPDIRVDLTAGDFSWRRGVAWLLAGVAVLIGATLIAWGIVAVLAPVTRG